MSAREISNIAATWLGLMAAIVGGHAAYMEFRENAAKQVDDRSMAAVNFGTQFQGAHMMSLREKVYGWIFCAGDCAAKRPSNSEIFAFVEFFDAVKYCADRNLCDAEIVKDVFGPYATWHYPCLTKDINSVRLGEAALGVSHPYGHGLEKLALKQVGTNHCGNVASNP